MKRISILVLSCFILSLATPCLAVEYLTEEEIIAAANHIKALTAENESLKRQVGLLEDGMDKSEKLVQQMSVQIQAWTALQESRNKQADDTIQMLLTTLNEVEGVVDKIDKKANRAEARVDFWRTASMILSVGVGVAVGLD